MMNRKYKHHISYKILIIYAVVFILLSICSGIIINITSEKQTDKFIKPIILKKVETLKLVYDELGFNDMMFIIKNQKDLYDFIVEKNGKTVYTTFKTPVSVDIDDDRSKGLVVYEFKDSSFLSYDHVGLEVPLDENITITVLLAVEELDLSSHITELIVQILIATYLIGLVTIGALIYKLRQRLSSINNDLDTITNFTSFAKRIDVESTQNEFDELAININKVLDHIEKLSEKRQMMVNNIAHDLRTPLTRLSNTLDNEFTKNNIESADEIKSQINQLLNIFDSVLRISKLESGQPIKKSNIQLNELLEDVYDLYQPIAEEKGLEFNLNNSKRSISADSGLLFQALANCIDNAIKYTEKGSINIDIKTIEERHIISIEDTGSGIPKEKRDDVLQLFYRLDSARTTSGTGLGLSMVNSIIIAHNAKLEILDNKPNGTIIKIIM